MGREDRGPGLGSAKVFLGHQTSDYNHKQPKKINQELILFFNLLLTIVSFALPRVLL